MVCQHAKDKVQQPPYRPELNRCSCCQGDNKIIVIYWCISPQPLNQPNIRALLTFAYHEPFGDTFPSDGWDVKLTDSSPAFTIMTVEKVPLSTSPESLLWLSSPISRSRLRSRRRRGRRGRRCLAHFLCVPPPPSPRSPHATRPQRKYHGHKRKERRDKHAPHGGAKLGRGIGRPILVRDGAHHVEEHEVADHSQGRDDEGSGGEEARDRVAYDGGCESEDEGEGGEDGGDGVKNHDPGKGAGGMADVRSRTENVLRVGYVEGGVTKTGSRA